MSKFRDLLKEIKARPGLYIGEPSIKLLKAFIGGYSICEYNTNDKIEDDCFDGFEEYIANKYGIMNTTNGWARIISFFSPTDRDAFYQFYNDFEEFSKLSKKEKEDIAKIVEKARLIG